MCPPLERRRGLGERGDASRGLCRFPWFFPKDAVGGRGEVSRRLGFVGEGRPRFFGGSFLLAEVVASAAASARLRMRAESRGVRGGDVIVVVIAVVVVVAEDRRRLGARSSGGAFPARGRFSPFAAGRFLAGVLTAPFFGARLALGGGATGSRLRAVFDRAVSFLARVASSGAVFVRGGLGDDEGFSAAAFFSCAQYAPFASARLPKVPRVTVARVRASYARTFHRMAPSLVTHSRMYEPGMGSCLGGAMAGKRAPCVSRGLNSLRPLFVSSLFKKIISFVATHANEKVARLLPALSLIPRVDTMRTATCARTGRCAHTRWRVLAPSARRQRAAPRPPPTTVTHPQRISRLSSRDLTTLTRATNKGDPFDMSGLSDAERAAMRQEWSLECRKAGLDHLSESFKKPSVLNPRDDAILPFVENNSTPVPIEALVSTVDATSLTPDLDRKLAFLNGEGVDTVAHTGNGKFDAHLIGVASVLKAWGCDQSVVSFILCSYRQLD